MSVLSLNDKGADTEKTLQEDETSFLGAKKVQDLIIIIYFAEVHQSAARYDVGGVSVGDGVLGLE